MIDLKRIAKRWILPITGSAAAMATIFYLYRGLDFGRFIGGLQDANRWWIAMLAATILLEQLVNGWKWRQVLYDLKPVSSLRLTGAMLAGYGANVLVPLGISPLVRAWLIARLEALQMGTVLTTTIIARFIDGVVFALFAGVVAVAGKVPQVDGNLEKGLSVAGALNLVLFSGLLWMMFRFRTVFASDGPWLCRVFDWSAARFRADGAGLRRSLCAGVIWPRARVRRLAVILGAIACIFRDIRPPIPTTSAHLYRGIRPALTRCREALVFDISFLAFRHVVEGLSFGRIVRRVRAGRRCAPAGRGWHLRRWVHQ